MTLRMPEEGKLAFGLKKLRLSCDFSKTRMLPDDIFNQKILQYLTLNNLGLLSLIVDYCNNITDANIISISENCNITDAYLSYELSFCSFIHPFRPDEYIKINHLNIQ